MHLFRSKVAGGTLSQIDYVMQKAYSIELKPKPNNSANIRLRNNWFSYKQKPQFLGLHISLVSGFNNRELLAILITKD